MRNFDEFFKALGLDNLDDLDVGEIEEELDGVLRRFNNLRTMAEDNSKLRAEINSLHDAVNEKNDYVKKLVDDKRELELENNHWKRKYENGTANVVADANKIAEMVEANKGPKLENESLSDMAQKALKENQVLLARVDIALNWIKQLQEDYDAVILKNQELVSDLETAKSFENKDILKQLRATQYALQEKIKEKNRLWNQLQDAEDICDKKDACIMLLKDELADMNGSLEASEASKEQYKKDVERYQTLVNSLQNDKMELKKDQEYMLNRVKKAEARVDELIKENNELHAQFVFNTVELDDCEETEDYIPGINIECETLNLTINNWPEPFEEDEE